MDTSIGKDKISVIEESRYKERIKKWEAFWNLEDADCARLFWSSLQYQYILESGRYPLKHYFCNKVMQLKGQLEYITWREGLDVDDFYVPLLQPYGGVTVFPSAFGCQVEFFDHTLPWAHPVIKTNDPAQNVYELIKPSTTDGQLGQMLEFTDYFVAETEGRYPIAMTDLQSPIDIAYLIWDSSEFMMAMYTQPNEVHHLMRMVTDLVISFIKEQRYHSPNFVPCHYPRLFLPDGQGISVSDDALAVLSPVLYENFAIPYLNELSEEFGGILIHSCGDFKHQISNLDRVHKLRGLNFGVSEMSFGLLWDHFNGKTALIPHLGLNKDIHFNSQLEFVEHILELKTHNRGLMILLGLDFQGEEPILEYEPIQKIVDEINQLVERYP